MNRLFLITGASGSGKTTAIENLDKSQKLNIKTFSFDSAGVLSIEEMEEKHGGPENWQKNKTEEWIKDIQENYLNESDVILDGQMRASFIKEACEKLGVENYEIILVDCSDEERKKRLEDRGQPELFNGDMVNWAKYLRDEAKKGGHTIIDNSNYSQEETLEKLIEILQP